MQSLRRRVTWFSAPQQMPQPKAAIVRQPQRSLCALALVLFCSGNVAPGVAPAAQAAVLAQDLANLRASGKVMAALWTARPDGYTLQLVFPYRFKPPSGTEVAVAGGDALDPAQVARVQVWLLKTDGSQVFPAHGSPAPRPPERNGVRTISYSLTYRFPLAGGSEAVALAVRINEDFYVDQLMPLKQ
jgi:hypothetical protein